jgi:hypothetical protein
VDNGKPINLYINLIVENLVSKERQKTLKFGKRLALIAFFPLTALVVILMGYGALPGLSEEASYRLTSAHRFLGFVIVAYIVNYLVAWKYTKSWPVSMTRMLIWGVAAYLSLSSGIDVFLNNRDMLAQVLGTSDATDLNLVYELRSRLGAYVAALVMACVCIGIGFEKSEESN